MTVMRRTVFFAVMFCFISFFHKPVLVFSGERSNRDVSDATVEKTDRASKSEGIVEEESMAAGKSARVLEVPAAAFSSDGDQYDGFFFDLGTGNSSRGRRS